MALRLKCTDTVGHRPAKLKLSLSCKTARYFINPSLPWWTVPHLHINGTQGIFEANTRWVTGEEIRFQFIKATGLPEKLQLHDAKTTDFSTRMFWPLNPPAKEGWPRILHIHKKTGHLISVVLCWKSSKIVVKACWHVWIPFQELAHGNKSSQE